jgi:hypothetical protein
VIGPRRFRCLPIRRAYEGINQVIHRPVLDGGQRNAKPRPGAGLEDGGGAISRFGEMA